MEAQFALYQAGILDQEIRELRRGYAKAILGIEVLLEAWELDKKNSMFSERFIESIDGTHDTEIAGFMGSGPIKQT